MSYHITICTAHKKALVQIYYWKGDPMQKQKLHSVGIEHVMLKKPSYHSLICLHSILCYDWQMGSIPLVEGMGDWRNISTLLFLVCLAVLVIEYVKSVPHHMVIADFGCGEARLAQSVLHTVHYLTHTQCGQFTNIGFHCLAPLSHAS